MSAPPLRRSHLLALVALGLLLRLPGVLFNGMSDLFEMLLGWGHDVAALGLAKGFGINYGVLSFASFGLAARLGDSMPRFYWLPYKVLVIAAELGVLVLLLRLVQPRVRWLVLVAYWLNPWMIWHGAYLGFWEAPYLLFGLLAVLALRRFPTPRGWAVAGVLLFASGEFKPQGWIHFAAPLGLFLLVNWRLRGRRAPFLSYVGGFSAAAVATSVWLWVAGAPPLALVDNFRSSLLNRPWFSNGGPGLWRFVTFVAMRVSGQPGNILMYRVSIPALLVVSACTTVALAVLFLAFSRRVSLARLPPASAAYLIFTFGALAVSQFGLRAHINHSYGALVLLIPLVVNRRRLQVAWGIIFAVMAVAILSEYAMGDTTFLPIPTELARFTHVHALAEAIRRLPAYSTPDRLIAWQAAFDAHVGGLVSMRLVSIVSLGVFAAAWAATASLFAMARSGSVDGLIGGRSESPDGTTTVRG